MRLTRNIVTSGVVLGGGAVGLCLLVACLSDPRADDKVSVIDSCDTSSLSTDPKSPQSSLRAYLVSSKDLLDEVTAVETQLKDGCNAVTAELGLAAGADALSACRPIAARIDALIKGGTAPFGPGAPEWAEFRFSAECPAAAGVLESCVAACAGPCDVSKCEPSKLAATCAGKCQGDCITKGDPVSCTGACAGDVVHDKAPSTCTGECTGICTNPAWEGTCGGACVGTFIGLCNGTCTGKCNGAPINPPPDAGAEGGAPPMGPPPTNANGNCTGTCVGICAGNGSPTSDMNGACFDSPCLDFSKPGPPGLGKFSGYCPGLCGGLCRSAVGTGSTASCKGTCTSRTETCAGTCKGACDGTTTNAVCLGTLNCGQNLECENACQARALLAQAKGCTDPKVVEVYAITDATFYAALTKKGAQIGAALERVKLLRATFGFVGERAGGDFAAIGLTGDLVRKCVALGRSNVAAASTKLDNIVNADPTTRKTQAK